MCLQLRHLGTIPSEKAKAVARKAIFKSPNRVNNLGQKHKDKELRGPPVGDVRLELLLPLLPAISGAPVSSSGRLMATSSSLVPDRLRLPLCFLGIFVCYFYYGILQEKITRGKYGEGAKQETFTFALTFVFIQCVINAVFAKILIQFFYTARVDRTQSWGLYAACSVSYLGAMVSSNSALQFVNYPTQVLGKSCKPIAALVRWMD
ncbi:PREDICTED: solute carrier family 35 member B1-like [Elephantulus edwardii]|uniref:solute carrier family 35 member B1-like n=1 Tax=Elephantulus edwardii TaxID=28737 RepID=UPI0003F08D57|nr:PREDICTED: solute carrier family 35 member B1-like [Elephantulus edwardii]